jgi:TrpR-related protein YerC/YecD
VPKKRFTEGSWRTDPWFRSLCSVFAGCKTEEDVANFLRDIGTLSELKAWSERLEVAKELARGLTYRQVAKNTGASTTTVTRVARFIESGQGGYLKFLKKQQRGSAEEPEKGNIKKADELRSDLLKKYL